MELDLQMDGGSEQASSSDDGQSLVAFSKMWKMIQKKVEMVVIRTVPKVIVPIMEDSIRKVVQEELRSAQEKFFPHGNQSNVNEMAISQERNLYLKFLDDVSLPLLTGKPIEGRGGTKLKVGLYDKMNGKVVKCGPESSGKVEIFLLDDNEHNWSLEDFNSRIIKEGDKTKPHFAKRVYIDLKNGIGILDNAKLGHDAKWMKKFKCRLGARMENSTGIKVQEARTESFMVSDKRVEFHGKSHRPRLSDNVLRLKNIGKGGGQRLSEKNIKTVKDFLFLQSIDPHRLQQIVSKGAKWEASSAAAARWKATVDHAQNCIINDKRVLCYPSSEFDTCVAFDIVGGLKGIIHHSHFIPNNNLSEDQKESAHKLLLSAFENQKNIKYFQDEATLLEQFPLGSSSSAPSSSIQDGDLSISKVINGCHLAEPDTSSQRISPPVGPCDHQHSTCHFGQTNMEQTHEPFLGIPNLNPGLSWLFSDLPPLSSSDIGHLISCLSAESYSHQQSDADRGLRVMLCMVRARKRFMALGGIHVRKRQRTN